MTRKAFCHFLRRARSSPLKVEKVANGYRLTAGRECIFLTDEKLKRFAKLNIYKS